MPGGRRAMKSNPIYLWNDEDDTMTECTQRVLLEMHFRDPDPQPLAPELLEHLATCPECSAAIGQLLDRSESPSVRAKGSGGSALPAAPPLSPRGENLLRRAQAKMRDELNVGIDS